MTTTIVEQTRLAFDYEALDSETRIVVQQRTGEIRERMVQTAQGIIEIGQKLIEVRDRLPHGQFGEWLRAEFDMSEGHARKMMQVARAFGQSDHYDRFAPTALYLLAAPGTPEEARDEALQQAAAGTPISAKAAEAIVSKHKPTPASTKPAPRPAAEELDEEPLDPYEQRIAAQHAAASAPPAAPSPAVEPEVIAELPAAAAPTPAPTPTAQAALPLLTPLAPMASAPTASADGAALRAAVALVALLEQALNLATLDLDQLQQQAGPASSTYTLPDPAVETAAKLFLASPAVKAAAGFLAMSVQEQKEAA